MEEPGTLSGRVALVTGSARNIGRATALALAADGASVVLNAVGDGTALADVAREVADAGGRAISILADVRDRQAVEDMVQAAVDAFGGLDILVCNASQRGQRPFLEMSFDEWSRVLGITLDGSFHLAQVCLPHMIERGGGCIITLGGASWHMGTPGRAHALVSKAGVVGLTRALAVEFASFNITVNCVAPGAIETTRPPSAGERPPMKASPHVGRMGRPEEVAAVIRFLCQPEASYITGQTLHINGGLYLGG